MRRANAVLGASQVSQSKRAEQFMQQSMGRDAFERKVLGAIEDQRRRREGDELQRGPTRGSTPNQNELSYVLAQHNAAMGSDPRAETPMRPLVVGVRPPLPLSRETLKRAGSGTLSRGGLGIVAAHTPPQLVASLQQQGDAAARPPPPPPIPALAAASLQRCSAAAPPPPELPDDQSKLRDNKCVQILVELHNFLQLRRMRLLDLYRSLDFNCGDEDGSGGAADDFLSTDELFLLLQVARETGGERRE